MKSYVNNVPYGSSVSTAKEQTPKPGCSRRDILLAAPMLTLSLLWPGSSRGQSETPNVLTGINETYLGIGRDFMPRISVGNVCGRVVDLPVFIDLAAETPDTLTASFRNAMSNFSNRSILSASSDYLEFRNDGAGNQIDQATVAVAGDVTNDLKIAFILAGAIEHDLYLGEELVKDALLSVSSFRLQMITLREQHHLLQAEEHRAEGGEAIYLPVQSRIQRSGTPETELLQREIDNLRTELSRVQRRAAELSSFILSN